MKALIIGASGQVGGALASLCVRRRLEVYGTSRRGQGFLYLDLADPDSVAGAFRTAAPDLVFLCSAMTNVDECEREPELSRRVNAAGSGLVAEECRKAGARLVYFSTEYVFDGAAGPYGEEALTGPVNVYGRTKLEGEKAALSLPGALALRTSAVYSHNPASKNFIMQLVGNSRAGAKMRVPSDLYSTPTYAPELAAAALDLAGTDASGVYNVAGPDWMSRYDFALKACAAFGFDTVFLEPKLTFELGQTAARPLKAGLNTGKLADKLGRRLPPVEESLRKIAAIIKQYE